MQVIEHEWPKGCKIFSVPGSDYHMSYVDIPKGKNDAAIFMHIDQDKQVCTVIAVESVANKAEAIKWYKEELRKRAAH